MRLTIEWLNDMALHHPDAMAFPTQVYPLTFAQLKQLVDRSSRHLFDDGVGAYATYVAHDAPRRIIRLCADHQRVSRVENLPVSLPKNQLSAALKTGHIQVLYTDLMDQLLEAVNLYGPFIGIATPFEIYHRTVWKVRFRAGHGRARVTLDEINSRLRRRRESPSHSN